MAIPRTKQCDPHWRARGSERSTRRDRPARQLPPNHESAGSTSRECVTGAKQLLKADLEAGDLLVPHKGAHSAEPGAGSSPHTRSPRCSLSGWEGKVCIVGGTRGQGPSRSPQATATCRLLSAAVPGVSGLALGHVDQVGIRHLVGMGAWQEPQAYIARSGPALSQASCEDVRKVFPWAANFLPKCQHGLPVPTDSHTPTLHPSSQSKQGVQSVVPRPASQCLLGIERQVPAHSALQDPPMCPCAAELKPLLSRCLTNPAQSWTLPHLRPSLTLPHSMCTTCVLDPTAPEPIPSHPPGQR